MTIPGLALLARDDERDELRDDIASHARDDGGGLRGIETRSRREPGERAELGIGDRQHLEQTAHARPSAVSRCRAASIVGAPGRARPPSAAPPAPRCRARARNAPCVTGPWTAAPSARAARRKGGEIDMDGQVGLAGLGQRVGEGVALHRLQRVAEARFACGRSRRSAPRRRAPPAAGRSRARPPPARATPRRGCPAGRRAAPPAPRVRAGGRRQAEGEPAVRVEPDQPLVPAVAAAHELAHRQGVEELVGDDQARALRHVRQPGVPDAGRDRHAGRFERRALACRSAGLVSTRCTARAAPKRRHHLQPPAARRPSACRGRGRARPARTAVRRAHAAARRRRTTGRSARRTSARSPAR